MKLICGRTTFIPGFCVFSLHHNRSGVSQPLRTNQLHRVTDRYSEWLILVHADAKLFPEAGIFATSPSDVATKIRECGPWNPASVAFAPLIEWWEITGAVSPPRPILAPISKLARRIVSKGSRYNGPLMHAFEYEIARQGAVAASPIIKSSHAVIAIISAAEQMKIRPTGRSGSGWSYNRAIELLSTYGVASREAHRMSGNLDPQIEREPAPTEHAFWVRGEKWSTVLADQLTRAIAQAREHHHQEVGRSHLLAAISADPTCAGYLLLVELGIDPDEIGRRVTATLECAPR